MEDEQATAEEAAGADAGAGGAGAGAVDAPAAAPAPPAPAPGNLFHTSSGGNSSNVSYRLSARKFIFLKSKMIPTSLVTPEMIHAWSRQLLFLCRCSSVNSIDRSKGTKEKRRV